MHIFWIYTNGIKNLVLPSRTTHLSNFSVAETSVTEKCVLPCVFCFIQGDSVLIVKILRAYMIARNCKKNYSHATENCPTVISKIHLVYVGHETEVKLFGVQNSLFYILLTFMLSNFILNIDPWSTHTFRHTTYNFEELN